jgi:hypothetical protein
VIDKELKKKLEEIADTVNLFKSEAVQLRVVDALLTSFKGDASAPEHTPGTSPSITITSSNHQEGNL